MDKFYRDIDKVPPVFLLQATPFRQDSRINFLRELSEQEFFTELYTETSPEEDRDTLRANRDFAEQVNEAIACIQNPFSKVDLLHISGYAGCGKTTFIRHLLWTTFDCGSTERRVVDFEGRNVVSQTYRAALTVKIFEDLSQGGENFHRLGELHNFKLDHFFPPAIEAIKALYGRFSAPAQGEEASRRTLEEFLEDQAQGFSEERYIYYLAVLDFFWELSAQAASPSQKPVIIFFDNVDSISDLEQNRLFIAALQQFIIDCSFFFVINLDNKNLFAGAEISGFIHDAKFVCFLTTRIVTIQRFLALAPNLEQVYGWTSLQMPVGFYNHMDILRRRMTYLQKAEAGQASKSMETLNSILDFAESAYKTNSFRKLFNGNFRFCLDALCTMVQHYSPTGLISECNRLYESGSNIEGASGMVLSMLCNYLKDQRIYEEKFHLSDCAPDGKLSLSRIILTIIRENGGRCSFLALFELLSPLFEIKEICDVAYDLMEAKRNVLRRMVAFDIVFPRSSQEVIAQGEAFLKGDREESHYSELSLCVSGRAYLDYMVPHFEFMLSRHRMEYDYITNPNYHPLFSRISERRIGPEDAEQVFIFERKIDWVFADVRDCCQNSVGFSTRLMEHFHWDRDTYINNSYFNYHMINRDGSPGYRQSYESRLIFSHIGYIERYRRYLLQKYKTEAEPFLQDINARLILRLRRYVELYQDEELCFHTPPQDTVADYLMRQIESIENAGYLDFRTKVEYNPLSA